MICVGHVTLCRGLAWPKWGGVVLAGIVLKAVAISTLIFIWIAVFGCRADCTMGKGMYFTDYSFPSLPATRPSSISLPLLVHFLS